MSEPARICANCRHHGDRNEEGYAPCTLLSILPKHVRYEIRGEGYEPLNGFVFAFTHRNWSCQDYEVR